MGLTKNLGWLSKYITADSTGKIGIGTATPNYGLNVVSSDITLSGIVSNRFIGIRKTSNTLPGYLGLLGGDNGDNAKIIGYNSAGTQTFEINASTSATYFNGGNVGIGTTSPSGKLSIVDTYYNTFFKDATSQYGSGLLLSGDNGSDQRSWKLFSKYSSTGIALTFDVSTTGVAYGSDPSGLTYSEKVRITSAGNVGIGTASPIFVSGHTSLTVNSSATPRIDLTVGNSQRGLIAALDSQFLIYSQSAIPLILGTNDTGRMCIFPSGNVFIGPSATDAGFRLDVNGTGRFSGNLQVEGGSYPAIQIKGGPTGGGGIRFLASTDNYAELYGEYESANNGMLLFRTRKAGDVAERMRITSGGYGKISNTGSYYSIGGAYHEFNNNAADAILRCVNSSSSPYGVSVYFTAADPNNTSLYIYNGYSNYSGTSLYTIWSNGTTSGRSDARLKKNIVDSTPKLDKLLKLRVVNYEWKENIGGSKELGLIAQEVEEIFPNLIITSPIVKEREVILEDGSIEMEKYEDGDYKSLKNSVLPYITIKALQELAEQVKELKAEIEILKNK